MTNDVREVLRSLDRKTGAIACMRLGALLVDVARRTTRRGDLAALSNAARSDDPFTAIAATHALGAVCDTGSDRVLTEMLTNETSWRREHAVWALAQKMPRPDMTSRLLELAADESFEAMLAQLTLERQAQVAGGALVAPVLRSLDTHHDVRHRRRLVETLGLDPRVGATRLLERVAGDRSETHQVRAAAIGALGDRPDVDVRRTLERIVADEGPLATCALLALYDRSPPTTPRDGRPGLKIAQLFLHADLDAGLTRAGVGDNGGIASLLVLLAQALTETPGVATVLTLSRGEPSDALTDALWPRGDRSVFCAVPMPPVPLRDAWIHRVAAERGIRRQLLAQGVPDVLHLRMADVGAMAGARVASAMKIPVVFTAAPDPHAVINDMDIAGEVPRDQFGELDSREHWWFRARLVETLARTAAGVAILPRPNVRFELPALLGLNPARLARRSALIPEGVSLTTVETAHRDVGRFDAGGPVAILDELTATLERLPGDRRDLPFLVTAGRLAAIKGVGQLTAAWAGAADLRSAYNLLVIGGNLKAPSDEEQETLTEIQIAAEGCEGLLLVGHRPHIDTARLLAYAASRRGIYVCGSAKEEFGLAIVEALAAGLVVVAPRTGGPSTYIDDGATGVLVDGRNTEAIRDGIRRAVPLVDLSGRVDRVRKHVMDDMTIEGMASALAELYARSSRRRVAAGAPV